jgi:choline dehydrogenase-like flavoprotein
MIIHGKMTPFLKVGAGSAGCVVANRLSEDPTKTVLLLEAGTSELSNPYINIPLASPEIQLTEHDWAFRTVPQQNACLAMVNQVTSSVYRCRGEK